MYIQKSGNICIYIYIYILFAKACLIRALPTQIMPPACLMGPSEPGVYLNSFTM